jgi:hypothetical protein
MAECVDPCIGCLLDGGSPLGKLGTRQHGISAGVPKSPEFVPAEDDPLPRQRLAAFDLKPVRSYAAEDSMPDA